MFPQDKEQTLAPQGAFVVSSSELVFVLQVNGHGVTVEE